MHEPSSLKRTYALLLLWAATAITLPAQTFTTVASFDYITGANPVAGLTQAINGDWFGTTPYGGVGNGVIFDLTPGGTLSAFHYFCQGSCTDGKVPFGPVIQAADGNFYGTTANGQNDCGEVFTITPSGTLQVLYSFCSQGECSDGAYPYAGLVEGIDGSLYGTTMGGGDMSACSGQGCGTVFKITRSGALTTLHSFEGTDGQVPFGSLVQASNGRFYGTTTWGGTGTTCGSAGCGTVFSIGPTGGLRTIHNFNETDGAYPYSSLIQAKDGNLYGTTSSGGADAGGTIFKISLGGKLTTFYDFCSRTNCSDGAVPEAGLVQATDGNFYGTTITGGANDVCSVPGPGCGTAFKITPSGTFSTLYNFCAETGCTDGANPFAPLFQATDGNLYGTTEFGGAADCMDGCGVVFRLSEGLRPFVETQPTVGKVGAVVNILGTSLTGTTQVTFNGAPATFTVESHSLIKATVPTGASTGAVQVTTSKGTLSSNALFQVTP